MDLCRHTDVAAAVGPGPHCHERPLLQVCCQHRPQTWQFQALGPSARCQVSANDSRSRQPPGVGSASGCSHLAHVTSPFRAACRVVCLCTGAGAGPQGQQSREAEGAEGRQHHVDGDRGPGRAHPLRRGAERKFCVEVIPYHICSKATLIRRSQRGSCTAQ